MGVLSVSQLKKFPKNSPKIDMFGQILQNREGNFDILSPKSPLLDFFLAFLICWGYFWEFCRNCWKIIHGSSTRTFFVFPVSMTQKFILLIELEQLTGSFWTIFGIKKVVFLAFHILFMRCSGIQALLWTVWKLFFAWNDPLFFGVLYFKE